MADNFKERFSQAVKETETVVYSYLPEETGHQKTIFEAMNYSVKAGGKRLRPLLMREVYRLFGGNGPEIEPFMAAMEMIHTSSLIHDDLPCMDNDEYRRGKLTTWKAYGYDMAVLAGDALMIYAFETASKAFSMGADPAKVGRAIGILAEKTGIYGMIGGQTVDVELTGKAVPREKLDFIYRLKTGARLHDDRCSPCGRDRGRDQRGGNDGLRGRSRVPDSGRYPRCDEHSGRAWKAGSER